MQRVALSVVLLLLATSGGALQSPPFAVAGGTFIALSVADVDASAKWYAETFSLSVVRARVTSPNQKAQTTVLSGHGLFLELVQHADAVPLTRLDPKLTQSFRVHGIFKAGLVVTDLDHTMRELRRRNVQLAFDVFEDGALGFRTFAIRDPAGNLIQFFGK